MSQDIDALRMLVIELGLPRTDMALFGVACPYCGKSDRIRELEPPGNLDAGIGAEDQAIYAAVWQRLAPQEGGLAVCKFCHNPVGLTNRTRALPLGQE
jgi:hypothetical protein